MRRVALPITAAFAVFSAFACGARSELLSELGGALGNGDGQNGDQDDGSADSATNQLDDAETKNPEASKSDASVANPCGGYQAYAPWPAFQRCSGHVGRSEAIGPASPVIQWSSLVGRAVGEEQGVLGPPTIAADGTIYIADLYGEVVAMTPTGGTKWTAHPTFTQVGPSAVAVGSDGSLYVELDQLYSIDANGGAIWSAPIRPGALFGPTTSSVTLSTTGQLYVGTGKGLVSVNPGGAVEWIANALGAEEGWTPAIDTSGIVYSGNSAGALFASGSSGTSPTWTFNVPATDSGESPAWIQTAPVIGDDGTIYFSANSGLFAFTPAGVVKWYVPWLFTPPPGAGASVAIGSDETVYVASPDSTLRSISPKGVVNWSVPVGPPGSPPVIDGNDVIYLLANEDEGGPNQTLVAVTKEGRVEWSLPMPGVEQGALAFGSDGTLYVAAFPNDMLYAIGN